MKLKKVLVIAAIALAILCVVPLIVAYVWGGTLDREHSATVTNTYDVPPSRIWSLLTDVHSFQDWRNGVKKIEVHEESDGVVVAWTEHTGFGPMPIRILEREENLRLVGKIDSEDLGFGGTWTYSLKEIDGRTELSITEDGFVEGALMRFISMYVMGHDGNLKRYHEDLALAVSR